MKPKLQVALWFAMALLLTVSSKELFAFRLLSEESAANPCATAQIQTSSSGQPLYLAGLIDPAIVSGAISVSVTGVATRQQVLYCLDGKSIWTAHEAPYALGPLNRDGVSIFSLRGLALGPHLLWASVINPEGHVQSSNSVRLTIIRPADSNLSQGLKPYPLQPGLQLPLSTVLESLSTPDTWLTPEEEETRVRVAAMYRNFGFDLSADNENDLSETLLKLSPSGWAPPRTALQLPLSMRFSGDSPFYQRIPKVWPRILLPPHLIRTVQLNTNQQGDGIGYGEAVAEADSPVKTITAMWYEQKETRTETPFPIPSSWKKQIPSLVEGDRHIVFVDPKENRFISLYKVSFDSSTDSPHALYAANPASFNSLGDHGGSAAARFAELPLLIQPGEATEDDHDIHHAIGGPISRVWAARVYPATSRDFGVLSNVNTCTNKGRMNTGMVPYGGIIQLDPALDLGRLGLSRPAFRILRAMQVYGYYVMDFGCSDLDIYTAVSEKEFDEYGGLYGFRPNGAGVQNEIAKVISESDLYVVPPVTKRP
jgi:hypothetical protein